MFNVCTSSGRTCGDKYTHTHYTLQTAMHRHKCTQQRQCAAWIAAPVQLTHTRPDSKKKRELQKTEAKEEEEEEGEKPSSFWSLKSKGRGGGGEELEADFSLRRSLSGFPNWRMLLLLLLDRVVFFAKQQQKELVIISHLQQKQKTILKNQRRLRRLCGQKTDDETIVPSRERRELVGAS